RPDEWAVVTSGSLRIAEPRLAALPVPPRVVVTADDVRRGKPDPEPYLVAAGRLGVADPSRCVVVEDAPAGVAAATAAGMSSVAVVTTHRREELPASVVVQDLRSVGVRHRAGGLVLTISSDPETNSPAARL
ncbi:MAG: HAD-IA family hydrolase, partial [Candidatus Dormibacteraeota bacterium]|nr:HAD-IA family hydrolase [Candidatus Dormibacteraeota bacterium]